MPQVTTVTLTGAVQKIVKSDPIVQRPAPFQWVTFYNPDATNAVYIGDQAVSATNGFKLAAGASKDFYCPQGYTEDLNGWYCLGTAASLLTVLVIQ